MPPPMVTVDCWRLVVRGRLRSVFDDSASAYAELSALRRAGVRAVVQQSTRRKPGMLQPLAPSAAQRHRESQADQMVVLRQATSYFKSGSNGTEIRHLPKVSESGQLREGV